MNQRIGTYELQRLVATGGMAEIWTALDCDGHLVAIKRILPHLARDERFTAMFMDEARLASELQHPNIATIHAIGHDGENQFLVMEFVDGVDLADLVQLAEDQNHFLPVREVVAILVKVLTALEFAHEFERDGSPLLIVHRDISPHNILVSREGSVKLVDFGVAKATERHHKTQTGVVKGKLSYMAPEQIQQSDVDSRADLFSLAVVGFELLVNQPPFGRDLTAISAILHDEPTSIHDLRPEVPQELIDVLLHALQKDPDLRYQRAGDMKTALTRWLDAQPPVEAAEIARLVVDIQGGAHEAVTVQGTVSTPQREPTAFVALPSRSRPTTELHSSNPAWSMVGFLILLALVAYWFFSWESAEDDVEATLSVAPAVQGFVFAEEWVDEWGPSDEELTQAAFVWQTWEPGDFLTQEWIERFAAETPRIDPGDPEAFSELDLTEADQPKTKKPRKKPRKKTKRRVKKKVAKKALPTKPKPTKRKPSALERVDRALPSF